MDINELLKIGEAEEITEDEKRRLKYLERRLKYLEGLDELVEECARNRKDVKVTRVGDSVIKIKIKGKGKPVYESESKIAHDLDDQDIICIKDSSENLVHLLYETGNKIKFYGRIYKLKNVSKFAQELYANIKDEETGFENMEETPLTKYRPISLSCLDY